MKKKKKNFITRNNLRNNLGKLFHIYLSTPRKVDYSDRQRYVDFWEGEYEDDDDYTCIYPYEDGIRKSKVGNDITKPFSGEEEDLDNTEWDDGSPLFIWFYDNISEFETRVSFTSLEEFEVFCAKRGYDLPIGVKIDLLHYGIGHCCIAPMSLVEYGENTIMFGISYADLYYCYENSVW